MIQESQESWNAVSWDEGIKKKWNQVRWFALYAKSRHEKLTDRELQKKGIETFLPMRRISRQWSDRKKLIEEPLFKGYLFVRIPFKERWQVLNTAGAVRFVGPKPSNPIEVPEKDIVSLRKFVEEEIPLDPFPYLKEGARVYISTGPFKGTEGYIVRKDRHCRLVISLDLLMQSVSVQVDEACVQPL
ncbi:MAG: UpxY family transcription antiterminator [Candidatus Omnitrophica bacterium]|nr:UpxY family transcription antiterminator [Candidatus Omnitrophota bacterium]